MLMLSVTVPRPLARCPSSLGCSLQQGRPGECQRQNHSFNLRCDDVDTVKNLIASDRATGPPCGMTTSEHDWPALMEGITEAHALPASSMSSHVVSKLTMTVNSTDSFTMELNKNACLDGRGFLDASLSFAEMLPRHRWWIFLRGWSV